MKIAFLNLCHTDPKVVGRVARKLTKNPNFDMYIHVDAKTDIVPFIDEMKENQQVHFTSVRHKVYWGGYNAIEATYTLLRDALASDRQYDYFVVMQNLDYPIKSNQYIEEFFQKQNGTEFIRGCKIARTKDWLYSKKYRLFYKKDSDFLINNPNSILKKMRDVVLGLCSITTIGSNGVIHEKDKNYDIHYGAAQWAVTRKCAEYLDEFEKTHPLFNKKMKIMQFPDEEYFHTVVHNSEFKQHCIKYDEPEQRWLVNWRNLHYFEFPDSGVVVFKDFDYEKLMKCDELFCRKVRSGVSDQLMNMIDVANN